MANALYTKAKEAFLNAAIDFDTDSLKLGMLSSAYTPNLATHQFLSDVNANLVGTPVVMAGRTLTNGVANGSAVTFTAVASGSTVRYFFLYKDTGTAATSALILLIDTTTGVALPIATNGGDITFTPDSGANKLFALV